MITGIEYVKSRKTALENTLFGYIYIYFYSFGMRYIVHIFNGRFRGKIKEKM
jgi:hypothetical protein